MLVSSLETVNIVALIHSTLFHVANV